MPLLPSGIKNVVGGETSNGQHSATAPVEIRSKNAASRRSGTLQVQQTGLSGRFWLAYVSNSMLMIAASLLYRYADFVTYLGGAELQLGWIVGIGMIGSMVMRLAQGTAIDRIGTRDIWLGSLALFVASLLGHLLIASADHPGIYVLHILYRTSLAGIFGASYTYVFRLLPTERMAEGVGTIGTAGFVGMIAGPLIGDLISGGKSAALGGVDGLQRWQLDRLFVVAALLGCAAFIAAWLTTRGDARPPRRKQLPLALLLKLYHPGPILLMGITMGVALGMPTTFLRTFAGELRIDRIAPFFGVYALVALVTRLATRRWSDRFGARPMILLGNGLMIAGVLCYLIVVREGQLILPATLTGAGHAILFPAVIAGGSITFPRRYRGLGTTLILAMMDLGILLGMPLIGGIVHYAREAKLPGYSTMFLSVAGLLTVTSLWFAWTSRPIEPRT